MHQAQRNVMLSPPSAVLEAAMNFTGTESLMWKVSRIVVSSGREPGWIKTCVYFKFHQVVCKGQAKVSILFCLSFLCYFLWERIPTNKLSVLFSPSWWAGHSTWQSKPDKKTSPSRENSKCISTFSTLCEFFPTSPSKLTDLTQEMPRESLNALFRENIE